MLSIAAISSALIFEEGVKAYVYDDFTGEEIVPGYHVQGHPTIGIGRALDTKGISHEEATQMLVTDIQQCIWLLTGKPWFDCGNENQRTALILMTFQLGYYGISKFNDMIAAINAGNWMAAGNAALKSKWAEQTPERARRVVALFTKPVDALPVITPTGTV